MQKTYTSSFSKHFIFSVIIGLFVTSNLLAQAKKTSTREVSKQIYFTANTGYKNDETSQKVLDAIVKSSQNDEEAVLIVLGNITPKGGFPDKDDKAKRKHAEEYLKKNLLSPLENFNGQIIYGPGVNEWNYEGHENIDDLESYLQDNLESDFWPNDGCALESEELSDEIELLMVDSQWFLEDWDKQPYINNKCEIKTREQFFVEFKDDIKDAQGKTVIVAVHHPILSSTRLDPFEKMGGFTEQAYYGKRRQELAGRMETLASQFEDVIFVSGNDSNLQFLKDDDIPQIISGSATAKKNKTKKAGDDEFTSTETGFAKLTVYKDGGSNVEFFKVDDSNSQKIAEREIKRQRISEDEVTYHTKDEFGPTYKASIYTDEETDKSGVYKWFWGDHYREVYSRDIEVPVLFIDTLPGNPVAIREGGGHQSRSLRIKGEDEHEYTLREIRKSALRFLQSFIKDHYVYNYLNESVAEDLVQDYYTTAQPYAPFAVNDLLKAVDIYHANPKLYYLPKQKNLGIYNEDYGDKLYMLEEHVGDENKEFETFGNADDIISTSDMLLELREDKEKKIDEDVYIRARLMDMLLGDWDRHHDQWRWAEFEQGNGDKIYKAIPRDRDQAFPKYDGVAVSLLRFGAPDFRPMQSYGPEIKSVKWLNYYATKLDKAMIKTASWDTWKKQTELIQNNLTDAKIDAAFEALPQDVKDDNITQIVADLKARRDNLSAYAKEYYTILKKFETVIGTENDDTFTITRMPEGKTQIQITNEDGKLVFDNTYSKDETNEIWIYGLDGEDTFNVEGDGSKYIRLNILGGENNDTYDFATKNRTKVYDYKSKKNSLDNVGKSWLTDSYEINIYDPNKIKSNQNIVLPIVAFDPDDGLQLGIKDVFTTYGLTNNPFSAQHSIDVKYHSATQGFSAEYYGEFAHAFRNWNFGLQAKITTPTYAINYFGEGNDTMYDEDAVDMDYNRVGVSQWLLAPSLIWKDDLGYSFYVKPSFESYELDRDITGVTGNQFTATDNLFERQYYAGGEIGFNFKNKPGQLAFIRRGMEFGLTAGYKSNIDGNGNKFGYVEPLISFDYPLHESGLAVLATKMSGKAILGDNYEFYHGATIGGNTSLRGYRFERFNGKYSYYQTTDLRVGITKFKTNFVPIRMGVTAGFDYGRVWLDDDNSNTWHSNYGGSVFINGFQAFTGNLGYYNSEEDARIVFTLGFKF